MKMGLPVGYGKVPADRQEGQRDRIMQKEPSTVFARLGTHDLE